MKPNTIIFLMIFSLILNACSSSFKTIKIDDYKKPEQGLIYSLPSTKLIINIEITEIQKQKGPFYEYLHLYFDTESGIKQDELTYKITDISIESAPVRNPGNTFVIVPGKKSSSFMLNMTPDGFPAGINLNDYQAEKIQTEQKILSEKISENDNLNYADFSLKSVLETKYDTLYKEIMIDSVLVKVPVITKKDVIKSKEKRAKEIADILFLLRDDRNALLKGENDGNNFPDGDALKLMISELNTLEKKYMSLFTGRITEVPIMYTFEIFPEKDSTSYPVAFFSDKIGISDIEKGFPLILKLVDESNLYNVSDYVNNSIMEDFNKSKSFKGLVYRIPIKTNCEIYLKNELLYKKSILISQKGVLNLIPAKVLDENTSVEFYPESGSLKRISTNK